MQPGSCREWGRERTGSGASSRGAPELPPPPFPSRCPAPTARVPPDTPHPAAPGQQLGAGRGKTIHVVIVHPLAGTRGPPGRPKAMPPLPGPSAGINMGGGGLPSSLQRCLARSTELQPGQAPRGMGNVTGKIYGICVFLYGMRNCLPEPQLPEGERCCQQPLPSALNRSQRHSTARHGTAGHTHTRTHGLRRAGRDPARVPRGGEQRGESSPSLFDQNQPLVSC